MFELSVIRKYLIPRRKNLSVALIGSLSIAVITLVVWLVLVFLSVTDGIEKTWLNKLTTLHAPVRITPTPAYFASYYYRIDEVATASAYSLRSIGEKAIAAKSDPYDPEIDAATGLKPDMGPDGKLKDPVKIAYQILNQKKLKFQEYELTGALLRLEMHRPQGTSFLTQVSYLTTLAEKNPHLSSLLLPGSAPTLEGKEIWLAKSFQSSGVRLGDRGYLSYQAATVSGIQEQRMPVYVKGFYDPGVMAVGAKAILTPSEVIRTINSTSPLEHFDKTQSNGLQVWIENIDDALKVRSEIESAFVSAGIDKYWTVSTYHDYDFAKELLQQFQSDRTLFTLLGIIILTVACSSILSLLLLLVNDKKKEIGILQALGAKPSSIALIFGGCGALIGFVSSLVGLAAALLTLHNLDAIVHFLSALQGHDMFSAVFYGKSLPSDLSSRATFFVLVITPILSLVAGLVPAIKACRLKPSEILRAP
ncbi:MAG: FtsX-like permease family protein [Verrucomicrobia bacterium]|nr:FtsX-like permease family protein [Verrucomicrobiota bacterium]